MIPRIIAGAWAIMISACVGGDDNQSAPTKHSFIIEMNNARASGCNNGNCPSFSYEISYHNNGPSSVCLTEESLGDRAYRETLIISGGEATGYVLEGIPSPINDQVSTIDIRPGAVGKVQIENIDSPRGDIPQEDVRIGLVIEVVDCASKELLWDVMISDDVVFE